MYIQYLRKIFLIFVFTLLCMGLTEGISYLILKSQYPDLVAIAFQHHLVFGRFSDTKPASVNTAIPLHPLYGWRYFEASQFGKLKVDSRGFILNSQLETSAIDIESDFRIVLIGGSTVAGSGASDNSQTISAHLEHFLEEQTNYNINVVNAGTGGWFSVNELAFLTQEILPFHAPNMIIWMDGYNDMWRAAQAARQFTQREDDSWDTNSPYLYLYDHRLQLNSDILSSGRLREQPDWLFTFTSTLLFGDKSISLVPHTLYGFDEALCPKIDFDLSPYLTNLRSAIGATQAHHIPFIYIFQPAIIEKQFLTPNEKLGMAYMRFAVMNGDLANYGVLAGTCLDVMQKNYLDAVRNLLVPLQIDLGSNLVTINDFSRLFSTVKNEAFYDYTHYTDFGNLYIAQTIIPLVRPLLSKQTP